MTQSKERDPLENTPYRSISLIGAGSHGTVWIAEHRHLKNRVAVKLLRQPLAADEQAHQRLQREAQVLARVRHPSLVFVSDLGTTPDGRVFFVMELLHGRSLKDEIAARGALPLGEAVRFTLELLDGLAAIHDEGLVHRDLKPANVFVCNGPPRRAKLLDLGVVKPLPVPQGGRVADKIAPLAIPTATGSVMGTPRFMAPEQARGQTLDARADLYAIGLVLYEMLAGRGPFDAHRDNVAKLMLAQVRDVPLPPSAHAAQPIAPSLDEVVLRALAKKPAARFQSAQLFAAALCTATAGAALDADLLPPADASPAFGGGTLVMPASAAGTQPAEAAFAGSTVKMKSAETEQFPAFDSANKGDPSKR